MFYETKAHIGLNYAQKNLRTRSSDERVSDTRHSIPFKEKTANTLIGFGR